MRYNGIQLIIRLAIQRTQSPLLKRYQSALILGAIREDVLELPRGRIWEHWSFSHFSGDWLGGGFLPLLYPGAAFKAQWFYDRALKQWRKGEKARALVNLGRVSHLLIDMACPTHARRVAHFTDGYEWYIDGNYDRLLRHTVAVSEPAPEARVGGIVTGMVRFTRQFEPDRTNHHWGRLLKRLGLRKSLTREQFAAQAEKILPEATRRLATIYERFLKNAEA